MSLPKLAAAVAIFGFAAEASASTWSRNAQAEPLIEASVTADPAKRFLSVEVKWPSGLKPRFPRDETGVISDRAVAILGPEATAFTRIENQPEWMTDCERSGCQLTYAFDFGKAVSTDRRGGWGFEEKQRIVMAPLSRWLVRPEDRRARGRLRVQFRGGKEFQLVSGVMDGRTNYIDTDLMVMDGPHVVLGHFTHKTIDLQGSRIDVAIGSGERSVRDEDVLTWIREAALDVTSLLGRFPVSRLQVIVASGGPYAVGSAVTMGMGGASIFVVVGEQTRRADLLRDWVMTHEMLHVAFPNLGPQQRWMEEGLSTYLEPLLRARRARQEPRQVWAEFVRAMPQGLPKAGDEGLDRTYTWGRRYWGGAMFWLHVDVEIRRRTEGLKSLDDVLRAILAKGGSVTVRWDVSRLKTVAENATGTTVVSEIYDEWSARAISPDLAALWQALGVRSEKPDRITFDDEAPLASIRRGMTGRPLASALVAQRPE